jgi:hypothetical protein
MVDDRPDQQRPALSRGLEIRDGDADVVNAESALHETEAYPSLQRGDVALRKANGPSP